MNTKFVKAKSRKKHTWWSSDHTSNTTNDVYVMTNQVSKH